MNIWTVMVVVCCLYGSMCEKECPAGTYSYKQTCISCSDSNCASCSIFYQCDTCKDGYTLSMSGCVNNPNDIIRIIIIIVVCAVVGTVLLVSVCIMIKHCIAVQSEGNHPDGNVNSSTRSESELRHQPQNQRKWINQADLNNTIDIMDTAVTCSICLQDKTTLLVSCHHQFHKHCLIAWYARKNQCPLCKNDHLNPVRVYCDDCYSSYYECRLKKIKKFEDELGEQCNRCFEKNLDAS